MTRGYVCVVNGAKIQSVAYLSSDAYLDYYGLRILQAIADGTLDEWMQNQIADNHACYGADEPDPQFSLSWIRRGKENKDWHSSDFMEYGYLYNEKNGELKVYHFGKLLVSVPQAEREKYLYFFKNASAIERYLSYDKDKMMVYWKPSIYRLVKNATIEEMQGWVEEEKKPRLILNDYHCAVGGHTAEYPVYKKSLHWSDDYALDNPVEWIIEKDRFDKKWNILLQSPYCRMYVAESFGSETSAMKWLRQLIKDHTEAIMQFGYVSNIISSAYKENRYEELKAIVAGLDEMWEQTSWFTPKGKFTPKEIQEHYSYIL